MIRTALWLAIDTAQAPPRHRQDRSSTMSRTPEQIAADDNLTAAIEAQQRAYHDDNEGVLTEYVIVSERTY